MTHSVRRRFLHGVRPDEPVRHLTELHEVAARVPDIQFVHAPRRLDDPTHIDVLGEICAQRTDVVRTHVAGGVLGDALVRTKLALPPRQVDVKVGRSHRLPYDQQLGAQKTRQPGIRMMARVDATNGANRFYGGAEIDSMGRLGGQNRLQEGTGHDVLGNHGLTGIDATENTPC